MQDRKDFDVVLVGAGFSGLYGLHTVRDKLGLSAVVLETADGVGGTWYWNRYPGARCDSESHSYCFTFSDDIHRNWEWSERYPGHAEVRRYLNYVADRLDLKRDIRFGTKVVGARYDVAANRWRITTEAGETYSAQFLLTGVGCLSTANLPDIPGRDTFQGEAYHTGRWPHHDVVFSGKRVGQIGTGSTGIQTAPVIAESADHLTVFQRTANYSIPANNGPLSQEFKAYVRDNREALRDLMQRTPNGHPFETVDRSVFDVTDDELNEILEAAWATGGLKFRSNFRDVLASKPANDRVATFLKNKIRQIVKDPKTADILADIDHPYAAKRPPIDTNYFETFNRDNVSLVDLRATPIEAITPTGIQTTDRHYDLDMIVFATGFDAMTGALLRMDIEGENGVKLADAWSEGPKSYLGLQVAGFPNLFTVTGPGSPSVLCNMPVPIEQHIDWIGACIAYMRKNGLKRIAPDPEAVDQWVAQVNESAKMTLLYDVAHSWYLGANVPGKPRVFMPYAGGMENYRKICDEVAARGYHGFQMEA